MEVTQEMNSRRTWGHCPPDSTPTSARTPRLLREEVHEIFGGRFCSFGHGSSLRVWRCACTCTNNTCTNNSAYIFQRLRPDDQCSRSKRRSRRRTVLSVAGGLVLSRGKFCDRL